jgi:hypothetical protein
MQISHMVQRGQYQLEQAFLLPIVSLRTLEIAPLMVLERLMGRKLP